ncbi:MAG: HEPN domain-containing protein [Desulfurococcaceae archaeon]|nr:HEPN domain-containing protein [Desulfurococcaceae archaeon]
MVFLDVDEYERWMKSAIKTLESARRDIKQGDYNWACFKAHQAGEKALKALLWGVGLPRTGHALTHLLNYIIRELNLEVSSDIKSACLLLDKYYVPTRYPNAWVEGVPEDYYSESEAEDAVVKAKRIIEWVEETWRELLRRGES